MDEGCRGKYKQVRCGFVECYQGQERNQIKKE